MQLIMENLQTLDLVLINWFHSKFILMLDTNNLLAKTLPTTNIKLMA